MAAHTRSTTPSPHLAQLMVPFLLNRRLINIIIQSLGFKGSESLDTYIKEKINTIKGEHLIRANVTLYKGPGSIPENNYCEIRLEVPGNDHFVKKHNPHFETAVSECIEVLKQQVNKAHDIETSHNQADSTLVQDALLEGEYPDDNVEPEDVVK